MGDAHPARSETLPLSPLTIGLMREIRALSLPKLDAVTFDALLREQDPFGSSTPRFNLSGLKFISPAGMVQLAAACHLLDRDGRRATIALSGISVPSYLLRANFVAVVGPIVRFNPPFKTNVLRAFDHLQGGNQLLIEVTKVDAVNYLPELITKIVQVIREELGYRKEDAFDIAIAISEVSQNTFEHALGSPPCCFVAMQVYGRPPKRFLEIGIADVGVGLAHSLRSNPAHAEVATDLEAIRRARTLGVSRHDDPTHGTGLDHLIEIAYKHQGVVQIRSGNATIRYRMDTKTGWELTVPHMPGVQVALTLPAQ